MAEHSESELKPEIQKINSHVKVDKVAKIPNRTNMFKILVEDAHSVETILHEGFKAFSWRISPFQINPEFRTQLVDCLNCYYILKTFQDSNTSPFDYRLTSSCIIKKDKFQLNILSLLGLDKPVFLILNKLAIFLLAILQSPRCSARKHASALGISDRSVRRLLHDDLHCHSYKMAMTRFHIFYWARTLRT